MKRYCVLWLGGVFLLAACSLSAQPLPVPGSAVVDPLSNQSPPSYPGALVAVVPPPKADTIEDILNKLDDIQAKKAELDKAEKEMVAKLKEMLKQQDRRLQKLGVKGNEGSTTVPAPAPASIPSNEDKALR
jgi:hypothetical protein